MQGRLVCVILGLVFALTLTAGTRGDIRPWEVDSAVVDVRLLAGTATVSDLERCKIERDMIAKERDMWKAETIKQAQNALAFERRALQAERSLDVTKRNLDLVTAQRDALLATPAKPVVEDPISFDFDLLPPWLLPVGAAVLGGVLGFSIAQAL